MIKKRIYLSIMGGIGDQIFQFSFANFLRKKLNSEVYLDITYYNTVLNYNKFKFRLVNLSKKNNLQITSNNFRISHRYISYLRIFNIIKLDIIFPSIYKLFFKKNIKHFIYEYPGRHKKYKLYKNSYYFGYWHNLRYVKPLKKNINKNLIKFNNKKPKIQNFIKYQINKKSVCLHIRGGDFGTKSSHNLLSQKYYDDSINFFKKKLSNPNFHIYTNDMKFSKKIMKNYSKKFKIKYIRSLNLSDIEEFCLFTNYNYSIIANSTFSLMSTYLSSSRKISTAPKIWLNGKKIDNKKKFSKLKFI